MLTNVIEIALIAALLLCVLELGWRIVQAVTILWISFSEDEDEDS